MFYLALPRSWKIQVIKGKISAWDGLDEDLLHLDEDYLKPISIYLIQAIFSRFHPEYSFAWFYPFNG